MGVLEQFGGSTEVNVAGGFGNTGHTRIGSGTVPTPLVRKTYEDRIPLGRIGSEEEIADVIVFVASYGSRYLTGQEIVVDGGLVINGTVGHALDD